MSEQHGDRNVTPMVREEPTQRTPTASASTTAVPRVRHRRSSHGQEEAPPQTSDRPAAGNPESPYGNRFPQDRARSATPRPAALRRVSGEQTGNRSEAQTTRRPVQENGYTQRRPLGYAYEGEIRPQPQTVRNEAREEKPRNALHKVSLTILILFMIIGLLVLGIHLIPETQQGFLGDLKRNVTGTVQNLLGVKPAEETQDEPVPEEVSFRADISSGYAPVEVTFTLTTGDAYDDVRLTDQNGRVLESLVSEEPQEGGSTRWTMMITFDSAYFGPVQAQALKEEEWISVGSSIPVSIVEETVREMSTEPPMTEVRSQVSDQVIDFSASPSQGTAPLNVAFSMTTSLSVNNVRLVDAWEIPLEAESSVLVDNTNTRVWALNYTFEYGYSGTVHAQVLDNGEWVSTGKACTLQIESPIEIVTSTPLPVVTPTPVPVVTESPVPTATEEPEPSMTPAPREETAATGAPQESSDAIRTQVPLQNSLVLPIDLTPTPAPENAPKAEASPAPTDTQAAQTAVPSGEMVQERKLTASAAEGAAPSLIKTSVIYDGTKTVKTYERPADQRLNMLSAAGYARQPYGVMTFRGSSFRQNAAEGTVEDLKEMEVLWRTDASSVKGASSTYYGIGWTGQPLIVKWSKEVRELSNILEAKRETKALREVILAGEDGNIYFLDLETGEPTRNVIALGYPMRGTPSVHSMGFPLMSVGQYARKMARGTGDIGLRAYDLLNQKQTFFIDGLDGKLKRPYYTVGSFETSSLFDHNSDSMVSAGTNGMLYVTHLNTSIDRTSGTMTVKPTHVSMKAKASGEDSKQTAVESSMAAYQNYVFYADMGGYLRCVDTNTMTTVWAVSTQDSVEAAIALDLDEEGNLWLYTANTLQQRKKGDCAVRCYNAMSGEMRWSTSVGVDKAAKKNGNVVGGFRASPVIGTGPLSELVFFTASSVNSIGGVFSPSMVFALNKNSGEIIWTKSMESYTYSSPVAVYTDQGEGYIIQAASDGNLYLLDGQSGSVVYTLGLDGAINASPAVYKDTLVIGTQGKDTSYIYGIALR